MPLNILAHWHKPLELVNGASDGLIYSCPRVESVPSEPGVYLFGRQHGGAVTPLYIGRSENLRRRLSQHLDSVRLMNKLRDAQAGQRFFLFCTVELQRGQKVARVLKALEDALIAYTLGEGYELLQKQGTRRPAHTVEFTGNRTSESIAPRFMRVRAE